MGCLYTTALEEEKEGREICRIYNFPSGFCCCFILFFELQVQHVEVPKLGVELKLQLPAYIAATATPDLSRVCDPHRSS